MTEQQGSLSGSFRQKVSKKYKNDEIVFNAIVRYMNKDSDEFKSLKTIADKFDYPYHRVCALKKRFTLGLVPAHLTACAAVVQRNIKEQIEFIDRRHELSEFLLETQYNNLVEKHAKGDELTDNEKKQFRETIQAYIGLLNSIEGSKAKFNISDSNVTIINSKVEYEVKDELRKILVLMCPQCQQRVIRRMGKVDGEVIDVEVVE